MIAIGNRSVPATFIRNIELENKSVVVTFILGHKLKVSFKSCKKAESEFRKVTVKFEKVKSKSMFSS